MRKLAPALAVALVAPLLVSGAHGQVQLDGRLVVTVRRGRAGYGRTAQR